MALEETPNGENQNMESVPAGSHAARNVSILVLALVLLGGAWYFYDTKIQTPKNAGPVYEEAPPLSGRREQATIENKGNLGIATTLGGEKYVVDRDGLTLYYNTADARQSGAAITWSCDNRCERNWLPYLVDETSLPLAESADPLLRLLNTFKRADGRDHYALQSKLLYRYRGDRVSGDMQGENWGEGWMIARP